MELETVKNGNFSSEQTFKSCDVIKVNMCKYMISQAAFGVFSLTQPMSNPDRDA